MDLINHIQTPTLTPRYSSQRERELNLSIPFGSFLFRHQKLKENLNNLLLFHLNLDHIQSAIKWSALKIFVCSNQSNRSQTISNDSERMDNKGFDFREKVVLITGSSSGIGAAIAKEFARLGARVVIHGRDLQALNEIASIIYSLQQTEDDCLTISGDLIEDDELPKRLIEGTIEKFGRLDILINNAGKTISYDNLDNPNLMDEFQKMFKLNVIVPLRLMQMSMVHLTKTGGNIVNVSSNASHEPILFTYSVTKAALDMLTKASAQELGPKGIRVNSINPGLTITGMGRDIGEDRQHMERSKLEYQKLTILNRCAYPSEMADLVVFLASDLAKNITGSIMVSDGGMLVKKRHYFGSKS